VQTYTNIMSIFSLCSPGDSTIVGLAELPYLAIVKNTSIKNT